MIVGIAIAHDQTSKSSEVAVVDIGVSNIASVTNALRELGYEPVVLRDPKLIFEFGRLILLAMEVLGLLLNDWIKLDG